MEARAVAADNPWEKLNGCPQLFYWSTFVSLISDGKAKLGFEMPPPRRPTPFVPCTRLIENLPLANNQIIGVPLLHYHILRCRTKSL